MDHDEPPEVVTHARNELAKAVAAGAGYRHAVHVADLAARDAPDDSRAWTCLAQALERSGDAAGAVDAYKTATERAPRLAEAHAGLAALLAAAGNDKEARWHLERATELDLNLHTLQRVLELATALEEHSLILELVDKYGGRAPTALLNSHRAAALIDGTMEASWVRVPGGEAGWIPTSREGVERMRASLVQVDHLDEVHDAVRERVRTIHGLTEAAGRRRYDGGYLVPIASGLLGSGVLWLGIDATDTATLATGLLYVLCVPLYLHAARVHGYRWNARRIKGEKGAGQRFAALVGGMNPNARLGCAGIWLAYAGIPFIAAVAPVIVVYHYIRNYAMK